MECLHFNGECYFDFEFLQLASNAIDRYFYIFKKTEGITTVKMGLNCHSQIRYHIFILVKLLLLPFQTNFNSQYYTIIC